MWERLQKRTASLKYFKILSSKDTIKSKKTQIARKYL